MQNKPIIIWACFAMSSSLAADSLFGDGRQSPARGEPAPPLIFEALLQAPSDASTDWKSLRGKVVVVDFWATWCAPCVDLFPFLDQLEERFADKPVRFISVTDEDETTVRNFLKKRPRKGWIALDLDRSVFSAYGIRGRPAAALIDTEGKVAGWINPFTLIEKPEIIANLLDGKIGEEIAATPSEVSTDGMELVFGDLAREGLGGADDGEPPLCLMLIRRAKETPPIPVAGTWDGMRFNGVTAREAIARVFDMAPTTMLVRAPLPKHEQFDVIYRWSAPNPRRGWSLLQETVTSTFGVEVHREQKELPVYVLSLNKKQHPEWESALPGAKWDPETGLTAPNAALLSRIKGGERFYWTEGGTKWLAFQLGHILDRPVVDEAGVEGRYLFYFPRNGETANFRSVAASLGQKYGLNLKSARRTIEVLVVEERKPPPPHPGDE